MDRSELTVYQGSDPYIFVSYMRSDTPRVRAILNILYRRGFRIWYDNGIRVGSDWLDAIYDRIDRSCAFIGFIASNIEFHEYVIKEMQRAAERSERDPDYKIVFVCLDNVSPEVFPEKIRNHMKNFQYINLKKLGGINDKLKAALCRAEWPQEVVDNELRREWGLGEWSRESEDINNDYSDDELYMTTSLSEVIEENDLCTITDNGQEVSFYRISPEHIDSDLVYPAAMDNQWVPADMYNDEEFLSNGLKCPAVSERIISRQRKEILRSLLHNRQFVVNRASMINSTVFAQWYDPGSAEFNAFRKLMTEGSVIVFLMSEDSPVSAPRFDYDKGFFSNWCAFCHDNSIYCLRFDWFEEDNQYENAVGLSYRFRDFCLTMAGNAYLQERIADKFGFAGDRSAADEFCRFWQDIQKDVIAVNINNKMQSYSRNLLYRNFLIRKDTPVDSGILDIEGRPFVREVKQVADHVYTTNLPKALNIRPLIPLDSVLTPDLFIDISDARRYREISTDELTFAIDEFKTNFLENDIVVPADEGISLETVISVRDFNEWKEYIKALSECRRQAHLEEVDFYDIAAVWKRYERLLGAVSRITGGPERTQRPAVSIIYRLAGVSIVTVYEGNDKWFYVNHSREEAEDLLCRKVILNISYLCSNVLNSDWQSVFVTEEKLFEGITESIGSDVYKALLDKLNRQGFWEYHDV